MAGKSIRPQIENPLANMGLDDIVRGLTAPQSPAESQVDKEDPDVHVQEEDSTTSIDQGKGQRKRRTKGAKLFEENFEKYAKVGEQGVAIWLPKEVKKKLELICAQSDKNIPIRSLASTIIMTYIEENENIIHNL